MEKTRLDGYLNYLLREAREKSGYTGEGLTAKVGMSSCTIYHYETLRRFPSHDDAQRIADALGVKVDDIFPKRQIYEEVYKERRKKEEHLYSDQETIKNTTVPYTQSPEYLAHKQELSDTIQDILISLTPLEKEIMILRYGLEDGNNRTVRETGVLLDMSPNRVNRIEHNVLIRPHIKRKLKEYCAPFYS